MGHQRTLVGCVGAHRRAGRASLLFADGGVSALGLNIINMAFIPAFRGYGLHWLARRLLPASRNAVLASTAVAA
jgi:cobalt/nickel transport system permease protein